MFLDCPAYLDHDGTRRCGLPAEVRSRFTMDSSDGPLEAAMIRCPSGHWFSGPIELLTCESDGKHHLGTAAALPSATGHLGARPDDTGRGRPAVPAGAGPMARPGTAPAYYLGRPARVWLTALSPRWWRKPAAGAQDPTAQGQPANPAHEPSPGPGLKAPRPGRVLSGFGCW